MAIAVRLVVLALAVGVVWFVFQMRYVFVVRIGGGGGVRLTKGKVTAAFVQEIGQICTDAGVSRGRVAGVKQSGRTSLVFSRSIPLHVRQQVRNLWVSHSAGSATFPRQRRPERSD